MKQGNVICFILKQQTTNDIDYRTDKFVRVRYHFLSVSKCFEQVFRGHNIVIRIYEKMILVFHSMKPQKLMPKFTCKIVTVVTSTHGVIKIMS